MLRLSDFDYHLPKELIAQFPLAERDHCRLMIVDRTACTVTHRAFTEVGCYLEAGDCLVLNDTRVLPSRLLGRRASGGKVEVLLLRRSEGCAFHAFIKPGRIKSGEQILFNNGGIIGTVVARGQIAFSCGSPDEVYAHGVMPLPPYIKRPATEADRVDYQTVYASNDGAIASPTAGLHFTNESLAALAAGGITVTNLTLHVGAGTFTPVKADDIASHVMDAERFSIPQETLQRITQARQTGKRVIAVGTTTLRCLEAYALDNRRDGETRLFIYPGFSFQAADGLLTNFHLPKTTLFMLVCAFAGTGLMKRAYEEAVKEQYRFYSYGDAMLII